MAESTALKPNFDFSLSESVSTPSQNPTRQASLSLHNLHQQSRRRAACTDHLPNFTARGRHQASSKPRLQPQPSILNTAISPRVHVRPFPIRSTGCDVRKIKFFTCLEPKWLNKFEECRQMINANEWKTTERHHKKKKDTKRN